MKYLSTYKLFEDVGDWNNPDNFTDSLDEDLIEDINDIVLDLEEHNISLKCWLCDRYDDTGEKYCDWRDVDRFISSSSISFFMYPNAIKHFLTKEELEDFIDVVNRVNDYLKTQPNDITNQIETHIHYHNRNRLTMKRGYQQQIPIDKVNKLNRSFGTGMKVSSISDISLTIVKE